MRQNTHTQCSYFLLSLIEQKWLKWSREKHNTETQNVEV